MTEQSRKVALPAYLPRRLDAFRIVKGETTTYLLRDKLLGKTLDLEPWQFFVLEVLPACETSTKLLSVFEDRFGRKITEAEVLTFFGWLADNKLLGDDAASHPLLQPFTKQGYALEQGLVKPKSFEELAALMAPAASKAAGGPPAAPGETSKPDDGEPAAGIADADNLDPRRGGRALRLFDLRPFLSFAAPLLFPLRWAAYLVPVLAVLALWLLSKNAHLAAADLEGLSKFTTLASHVVASLLTINLAAVLTQSVIAHRFRATVSDLGIALYLGFLPRFVVRIRHTQQLSRRERMWIHGGPLLMRAFLFSVGALVWYNTRDSHPVLSTAGLALAFMAGVNLLVGSANPLVRGNAYHLLAAFVDEPHLRGKSYRAFMSKIRGGAEAQAGSNVLAAYALATFIYMYVIAAVAVIILANFLQRIDLGGAAFVVAAAVGIYLLARSVKKFRAISTAYDRAVQFDRWRQRALPAEGGEFKQVEPGGSRTTTYVLRVLALLLLLLLFLPYPYEPGGQFQIFPAERQVITTDVAGIIEEVNFDGGETVKKGTVLGRISSTDLRAEVDVIDAKIAEQRAVIADLKARPKAEEVAVARRALETAQQRASYSSARVPRLQKLFNDKVIAFEELDAAKKEADVDALEVAQREAALELVKKGTTPERLQAEGAKLESLVRQRAVIEGRVVRTTLVMPFDGNILTLHLKDRLNSLLDKGQPFTVVESTGSVTAEIEVPEFEIGYVEIDAPIQARPNAFSDVVFEGKVRMIDRNVTVKPSGNFFKVIAVVDNRDGSLRNGMTGFAKIDGTTMPVWKAFSMGLQRFVNVQLWSWIP